jgi:hypothetical protein
MKKAEVVDKRVLDALILVLHRMPSSYALLQSRLVAVLNHVHTEENAETRFLRKNLFTVLRSLPFEAGVDDVHKMPVEQRDEIIRSISKAVHGLVMADVERTATPANDFTKLLLAYDDQMRKDFADEFAIKDAVQDSLAQHL